MPRNWRLALATFWVATLLLVAAVAVSLGGGRSSAAPRRLVVQPPPAVATTNWPTDLAPPPTAATTTPSSTAATVPSATAATAPPTSATPAGGARVAPAPVARTATASPANNTPVGSGGNTGDFTLIGYRWNPCHVITIRTLGPDIAGIVSELASITGLHLQLVSGPAEITVQWGPVPAGGGEIGMTAWRAVAGWLNLVGINISQGAQPFLATVLRHELGHSLGLGHASHPDEIMYPTAGYASPTDYRAGDIAGLRAIGAAAGGC